MDHLLLIVTWAACAAALFLAADQVAGELALRRAVRRARPRGADAERRPTGRR
jgi:hypothetical protein